MYLLANNICGNDFTQHIIYIIYYIEFTQHIINIIITYNMIITLLITNY